LEKDNKDFVDLYTSGGVFEQMEKEEANIFET